jgi:SAM-dependent methyltransferase
MTARSVEQTREIVRDHYRKVANAGAGCCAPGCCAPAPGASLRLGYTPEDLSSVPVGADMGLGCGNPQAIAALRPGEIVIDLGSGGGFDCFLAARQVGPEGRAIGVDMTPEMIAKARANALKLEVSNVEFRLGEIEHLPVADATADVVLSNCVINLSPDKGAVFREAFRALRPGGRLAISDVVATGEMPAALREKVAALTGCVAGAPTVEVLRCLLQDAGFSDIRIGVNPKSGEFIREWMPGSGAEDHVSAATIEALKRHPREAQV